MIPQLLTRGYWDRLGTRGYWDVADFDPAPPHVPQLLTRGHWHRLLTRGYWDREGAAPLAPTVPRGGVDPRRSRRRAALTLDVSSEVVGEVGVTFSLPTNLDVTAAVVRSVQVTAEEEDE